MDKSVVAMVIGCHVMKHTLQPFHLTPDLILGGGFNVYIRTLSLLDFLRVINFLT